MTLSAERATIEARWKDQWVSASPSAERTVTGYDGFAFEPVKGASSVRLSIRDGEAGQMSFGDPSNNVSRSAGVVLIQIFAPGGQGTAAIRTLEDAAMAIFRNWTSGTIRFGIPYSVGRLDEPPFLVSTVACPFQRDEYDA